MISIYVIQIALIIFFGFLFRNDKKKFLIAAFIILYVVMAFRDASLIGNDSASSYRFLLEDIQTTEVVWPNPGIIIVMKIVQFFKGDYQWFIVLSALLVCYANYRLLVEYSENGFISVMWFMGMLFYTFSFSALKQAWAMAFLCFAFDAILKKKIVRFLLFVCIAVLFHFPALIFLPAYWIAKLKINKSFPLLMLSILLVVFIFRTQIIDLMTSMYTRGELLDYSSNVQFFGTKFVFMLLMLAYGFYRFYSIHSDDHSISNLFSVLLYYMGVAAVIQTFCFFSNNFERLADYYYQFSILFVPLIISRKDFDSSSMDNQDQFIVNNNSNASATMSKKRISNYSIEDIDVNSILSVVIAVFCIWRYISFTNSGADNLIPFYFFWQGMSTHV